MKSKITLFFILLSLITTLPTQAQSKNIITGPIIGNVTHKNATLWLHTNKQINLTIHYGQPALYFQKKSTISNKDIKGKQKFSLSNLKPNTHYAYTITNSNNSQILKKGSFKTPPHPNTPTKFKLAATSCMKKGDNQQGWVTLLNEKPDIHLMIGDSTYADTTDYKTIWEHQLAYRAQPEYAKVLANVPTYAVWDDHDYGPNNSDGTAKGKENSLRAWTELFPNPKMGTKETPGVFHTFNRGDVQIFMLDTRYHRSPDVAPDDKNKRMIGDAQFNWLKKGLKNSKAKFKVLAMGSTLQASSSDGWRIYTYARKRLYNYIMKNNIKGVIFISGDIHRSLIQTHNTKIKNAYPITEVISSGITRSKQRSFATIEFDITIKDPTATIKIINADKTITQKKTLKYSQLKTTNSK